MYVSAYDEQTARQVLMETCFTRLTTEQLLHLKFRPPCVDTADVLRALTADNYVRGSRSPEIPMRITACTIINYSFM